MRIIVACDGSQESRNAIRLAAELPLGDKEVEILSVSRQVDDIAPGQHRKVLQFNTESEKNCELVLSEARDIAEVRGLMPSTRMLTGYPSEEICRYAFESACDLIIMGHRGLNPIRRFFMGSVSDGVLRHSDAPVLLTGATEENGESLEFQKPLKILICYDGSEASEKAFAFIKKFHVPALATLDILSVIELEYYFGVNSHVAEKELCSLRKEHFEKEHARIIQEMEDHPSGQAPPISSKIIMGCQDAASRIAEVSENDHFDLVVVGNKGLSPIDRLLLGSVSSRLAHQLRTPLLIVR